MTAIAERLSSALADRYRIERELGQGGMATVYLAQDLKHDRKVAIKVLLPELAAALGHERFLREITTTANLRHPHILPLYDSGEADGFLFYAMPFVEGESLRDRLTREKQLPLDEALQIAREVSDALSYAHSRGVIHRDIKPENILLEAGHAVVADFGIARAIDAAGGTGVTQTGLAIGTPGYMSPEQAAGEHDLDGRSDLYALGCVLYEMLAGQPPFTGPNVESIIRQHMTVDAPPVTNLRPAVPPTVAAALQRALAKMPADRFNPVAQFSDALRPVATAGVPVATSPSSGMPSPRWRRSRAVVGVAVIGLVAAAVGWGVMAARDRAGGGDEKSIAVLPFVDLSPDQSNAYLGDGLAETLINTLANVPGLEVAARTSAFSFRGKGGDVREIGRALGVATVLEGSVQRAGTRLRITAQLVKTSDGLHLWSRNFDRDAGDIFDLQDEVAKEVTTALRAGFLEGGARTTTGTRDPAAYDAYLQGRFFWNKRAVSDLERAIEHFRVAIARDSLYAQAWAGLADTYLVFPFYSSTPSGEYIPKAREAAERALRINPDLAEAHATLAYALTIYYWDWAAAEREFRRAIDLNPDYATAHKWYSDLLNALSRAEESLRVAQLSAAIEPLSPNALTIVGVAQWQLGHHEEALAQFAQALELDPTYPLTLMHGSWLYWVMRDTARFFAARERLDAVSERGEVRAALLRQGYAAGGRDSVMRLEVASPVSRRNPLDRARWNALLGDLDAVFEDVEQAARERNVWLPFVFNYPAFAAVRADPRYDALRKRMGLPEGRAR